MMQSGRDRGEAKDYANDNNGNGARDADGKRNNEPQRYTANTAQRNYSHNEYAAIYLPKSGWLTPILMDVNTNCDNVAGIDMEVGPSGSLTESECDGDGLYL